MPLAARRVWDDYTERLAPLGFLRLVDGFALQRLCEDVVELHELQAGRRKLLAEMKRSAKQAQRSMAGGPAVTLASSAEGRRLALAISQLHSRIMRLELQFGLTPASAARVENGMGSVIPFPSPGDRPGGIEAALCG